MINHKIIKEKLPKINLIVNTLFFVVEFPNSFSFPNQNIIMKRERLPSNALDSATLNYQL